MSISQNFPIVSPSLSLDFANTKVLDSRITFSRPTSAVYYDGQTVTKAEENLVLYSQEFDNAYWGKNSTTVVANSIDAPDGTTTADTLSAAGTGLNALFRSVIHPSGLNTVSIYAKKGTKSVLQFSSAALGVPAGRANFDLDTGSLGTVDVAWDASIIDAGNGWYRCVATFIGTGTTGNFLVSMQDSTTAARDALSTAGNLYLWGLQWEVRDAVTAYQPTTTQPITNYIPTLLSAPANSARFDHNPVTGESLGLLVEEQRTNFQVYSDDFNNEAWSKLRTSITSNAIVAPDGTLTGDKLVENTDTNNHQVVDAITASAQPYTISVYAKAGERQYFSIAFTSSVITYAWFDLLSGTTTNATNCTSSIKNVGNGWYRCSITTTALAATTFFALFMGTSPSGYAPSYTGDGYSGIYIWGAQLEAGSFPTSYIKTEASQVTRSADSASMTGANFSDWYRQDEGSIVVGFTGFGAFVSMSNANSGYSQYRAIYKQPYPSPVAAVENYNSVAQVAFYNIGGNEPVSAYIKVGYSYKFNDFAALADGLSPSTDTIGSVATVDRLGIGYDYGTSAVAGNFHIKKLSYYPQRLSNENLQALTS